MHFIKSLIQLSFELIFFVEIILRFSFIYKLNSIQKLMSMQLRVQLLFVGCLRVLRTLWRHNVLWVVRFWL